jgi:hypothetical protein
VEIHLYLLCFRTEAIVASHLPPHEFGSYMAVGTLKRTFGNVLFFELDPGLRLAELGLDQVERRCVPHPDGAPRRSKYMSVYRVFEHVPMSSIGDLFLTTRDGRVAGLSGELCREGEASKPFYMYDELSPLTPRVVSRLAPVAFARHLTAADSGVRVPKIFFADLKLTYDAAGKVDVDLPYAGEGHVDDCLDVLRADPAKLTKTVDRNPPLDMFFRTIDSGFYVGDATATRAYAFPTATELDLQFHEWWRSASLS